MIQVVNKRKYKGSGWEIGRPSPLGNPFILGRDGIRDVVIDKYRAWITERLKEDNETSRAFREIVDEYKKTGEMVLICWCAPLKCHGDILKELIEDRVGNITGEASNTTQNTEHLSNI